MAPLVEDLFGLAGCQIDAKYTVEEAVAGDGFGVVYRGRHDVRHSALAIKVLKIPPEYGDAARGEFIQR